MSGRRQPSQVPDLTGINLQTSSMCVPIPLAYGQSRGSPNLMDYTDYQVHKQAVGKGGVFGGKQYNYTYSATIELALSEGPITGIGYIYVNQGETTGLSQFGFTLFTGTTPQSPWSYMSTHHPTHAQGYQGVAYLAAANYNMGSSEALPSQSYEVKGLLWNTASWTGGGDADAALVIKDFLTNSQYGTYLTTSRLDLATLLSSGAAPTTGDSAMQTYCQAMGFGISPFLQSQESGITILARWCQIMNTAPVWTGYTLKLIPMGDETITANGVTYNPPTSNVFSFTDDDYINKSKKSSKNPQDPVIISRLDWYDAYNAVVIECRDRGYLYNSVPIDWIDQGKVDVLGRRQAPTIQAHEICITSMAKQIVELLGKRVVYLINLYTFQVAPTPQNILLEPMDCGTITVKLSGGADLVSIPVRVREINEQDDDNLEIVCEDFPGTLGQPATVAVTGGAASPVNSQVVPDSVNPPIIFEPASTACAFLNNGSTAPLVVALVSGGSAGVVDPNWGGCIVWVSTDGTTYVQLADVHGSTQVRQPASMGPLTGSLASYGGANPDTTNTLGVNLFESNGTLTSASSGTTAAAGATLGVIQDTGLGAIELVGPQTATLVSGNTYNLTTLYRGLFSTTAGAHTTSSTYGRLDSSAFIAPLPPAYISIPLHFKFQSFNIFQQQLQDLSTCTVYTYTPLGTGSGGGTGGVPTTPTGLVATGGPTAVYLSWSLNPVTDNVTSYQIWRAPGASQPFGSASKVGSVGGGASTWVDGTSGTGTFTYFIVAVNTVGSSSPSASANATVGSGYIYLPSTFAPGLMTASQQLLIHTFVVSASLAANLAGWQFGATANATSSTVIGVYKALAASPNTWTLIGTITIGAGTITPTLATVGGSAYTFAVGDRMMIQGPSLPDPTLTAPNISALLTRTS